MRGRCGLLRFSCITGALTVVACSDTPQDPTFHGHVAPILYEHCVSCHHVGGPAPFSLVTYDDARERAALIAAATRARRMPPWLPEAGDFDFADESRLSEREIRILERWAQRGAVRGDSVSARPAAPRADDWPLGRPDLVLELPEAYPVSAGGSDVFRNFVIPVPIQDRRYVRALDLQPGDARVVHHVVLALDASGAARQEDALDEGPGFDGMFSRRAARPPTGFFVGWTPGRVPRSNPGGLAWELSPGTDIVLQMHLRPHGQETRVRPRVGLYFGEAPARTPILLRLGAQTLDIPPGSSNYEVSDSLRLPAAVEIFGLYPHAHYLGKVMDVRAVLPDGRSKQLLRINDWNFNWQDAYTFERPVVLPEGTVLRLRYVYDNSASNPRNPHQPPKRVVYGPHSTDEMAELWLQAVARNEADLPELQRTLAQKATRDYVQGWQHLIRLDSTDALAHANLGAFYQATRDYERARYHYRQAIATEPDFASAHYNLALVLEASRDPRAAARHYREAVRAQPAHARAHNNLGNVLLTLGRTREATEHLRRAIELEPKQAEPRNNLGRLLWQAGDHEGALHQLRAALALEPRAAPVHFNLALVLASLSRTAEALDHFEAGLRLQPNSLNAYVALAWLLATDADAKVRRPGQALALAERAARRFGASQPRLLDVLAAAHAAAGNFERAAEFAGSGVKNANNSGQHELAAEILQRMQLYMQDKPYIQSR